MLKIIDKRINFVTNKTIGFIYYLEILKEMNVVFVVFLLGFSAFCWDIK